MTAVSEIVKLCHENGIEISFFKAPTAVWTQDESLAIKEFMSERGFTFLEMNDYLSEMGIDPATDFYDPYHLNNAGATKATAFIADYLKHSFEVPD